MAVPAGSSRYERYFYHCFPYWVGKTNDSRENAVDCAKEILSLILEFGLLLTPEEIVFRGEPFRDGTTGPPVRIFQKRFCLTELAADEIADHAAVFGPVALEFDATVIRRLGAMPVVYVPQAISGVATQDRFALVGQTFVYRLFDCYQLLEELAQLKRLLFGLKPPASLEIRVEEHGSCVYPVDLLEHLLNGLVHQRQSLSQLSTAVRVLSCLFYPTDAQSGEGQVWADGRLSYYREREWRIINEMSFADTPLAIPVHDNARDRITQIFHNQKAPYDDKPIDGDAFVRNCRLIPAHPRDSPDGVIRRIHVADDPPGLYKRVVELARNLDYKGSVQLFESKITAKSESPS